MIGARSGGPYVSITRFNSRDGAIDRQQNILNGHFESEVSIPEMVRLIAEVHSITFRAVCCFNSRDGAIDSPSIRSLITGILIVSIPEMVRLIAVI